MINIDTWHIANQSQKLLNDCLKNYSYSQNFIIFPDIFNKNIRHLKCFTDFAELRHKIFKSMGIFESATSYVVDQDVTTEPQVTESNFKIISIILQSLIIILRICSVQ